MEGALSVLHLLSGVASAIEHVYNARHMISEVESLRENFEVQRTLILNSTRGSGHLLFAKQALDLETQCFYRRDGPCVLQVPHIKCLPIYNFTCTTRRHTSDHFGEMKILEAELLSLEETLRSLARAIHCQHDEEKVVDLRLEDILKMVVSVCEEACARVNEAMSKVDHKKKFSGRRSFYSLYQRLQTLVSNKDSARLRPSEDCSLLEDAAAEKQNIAVDTVKKDIIQQALSIRDRVRAALPDQGSLHQIGDRSDALCFLLGTVVCPPLMWLTIQSLNLEPPSLLDERFMQLMPSTATLIKVLSRHTIIALTTMTSSITISTGALAMPVWKSCTRGRSSAFVSCWLLIIAGSLVWSHMGGSIAGLFLVFMPFALGLGVALGLLWHKRMSHAHHIRWAVSKCGQDDDSNRFASPHS